MPELTDFFALISARYFFALRVAIGACGVLFFLCVVLRYRHEHGARSDDRRPL